MSEKFKEIKKEDIDNILKPEEYEYVPIEHIRPGLFIRWWDADALVVKVRIEEDKAYVTVVDPRDGKEKEFPYKINDELIVKVGRTIGGVN